MDRRKFFKAFGVLTAALAVAPFAEVKLAEAEKPAYRNKEMSHVKDACVYGVHIKNIEPPMGSISLVEHPLFSKET